MFLLDLHVDAVAHYFESGIRTVHVYGKTLVTAAARRLAGEGFVLACTDAGRAKWVESLANDLGVDAAFVFKRRTGGDRTQVPDLARAAVACGVDGLFLEVHEDPDTAPSDGPNMLRLADLPALLDELLRIREAVAGS